MKRKQLLSGLVTAIGVIGLVSFIVLKMPAYNLAGYGMTERTDGGYYTIVDENNVPLLETGILVTKGDEFINWDDQFYEVTRVAGDIAYARSADLAAVTGEAEGWESAGALPVGVAVAAPGQPVVGIYHTHSDESYNPTSGRSSKPGKGDIFAVGGSLAQAMEQKGFNVIHDKSAHDPHDAAAYKRSRRTAASLIKQQASILIDVHRDSAPVKAYATKLNGQGASKVTLVVGRQNPKRSANLAVARSIKAAADKKYPGLFRAIFMARSSYNQDLGSQVILLEFGTNKQPLEAPQRSTAAVADVLASVFGAAPAPAAPAPPAQLPGAPGGTGNYVAPQDR